MAQKPSNKPQRPEFSSGPCAKRPGWSLAALEGALLGRSHRAKAPKQRLQAVIERSKAMLGMPAGLAARHRAGLRHRRHRDGDVVAARRAAASTCSPGRASAQEWVDRRHQAAQARRARARRADTASCPISRSVDFARDVVFTWNGTTSGVRVPNGDWIPADRAGPRRSATRPRPCSRWTSPWDKLDVVTWSWQKVLGGEAAHGMLALSPRAVERLESYTPPRPMPKIFRMTKKGKLDEAIFEGSTINTPSMLCVEDALDGLAWAESVGGLRGPRSRARRPTSPRSPRGSRTTPWVAFLARDPKTRSCTSICLADRRSVVRGARRPTRSSRPSRRWSSLLEKEGVASTSASYRDAPPGLRIWGGATVERADIEALLPWLDWAFAEVRGAG